jgi:hypothetical protein
VWPLRFRFNRQTDRQTALTTTATTTTTTKAEAKAKTKQRLDFFLIGRQGDLACLLLLGRSSYASVILVSGLTPL